MKKKRSKVLRNQEKKQKQHPSAESQRSSTMGNISPENNPFQPGNQTPTYSELIEMAQEMKDELRTLKEETVFYFQTLSAPSLYSPPTSTTPVDDGDQLLTTKEAADFLQVTPRTISNYVKKNLLNPERSHTNRLRFRLPELHAFLKGKARAS